MAKYKVIPIALLLKNNVIAYSGDEIDESQLNSDAAILIQDGFIEEVKEEAKAPTKPAAPKAPAKPAAPAGPSQEELDAAALTAALEKVANAQKMVDDATANNADDAVKSAAATALESAQAELDALTAK